jgi:hypothetical protein
MIFPDAPLPRLSYPQASGLRGSDDATSSSLELVMANNELDYFHRISVTVLSCGNKPQKAEE